MCGGGFAAVACELLRACLALPGAVAALVRRRGGGKAQLGLL